MAGDPTRVRKAAPSDTPHWQRVRLREYGGGPFADRTGGLITFVADQPQARRSVTAGRGHHNVVQLTVLWRL